jgi:hypothetical protein
MLTNDCLIKIKDLSTKEFYAEVKKANAEGNMEQVKYLLEERAEMLAHTKRRHIYDYSMMKAHMDYINERVAPTQSGVKQASPKKALEDMVHNNGSSGIVGASYRVKAIVGKGQAMVHEFLHKSRPGIWGITRKDSVAFGDRVVDAIFGSTVEDPMARDAAKAVSNLFEYLRVRFNRAGGAIVKNEKYHLPSTHNAGKISEVPKANWVKDVEEHMVVRKPGKKGGEVVVTDQVEKRAMLDKIYENITRGKESWEGVEDVFEGTSGRRGIAMGNKHKEFRYLQPKDGEAWKFYNAKYGYHADPSRAVADHLEVMATEIGLMETFGSNPQAMLDNLKTRVGQMMGNPNAGDKAQKIYDQVAHRMLRDSSTPSKILQSFTAMNVYKTLGMAPLTAVGDNMTTAVTAFINGSRPIKTILRHFKNLNPADLTDQKLAGRFGATLEYAMHHASANQRMDAAISEKAGGVISRMADFSLRYSGLDIWTRAAKSSLYLELLGGLADQADNSLQSITSRAKNFLKNYNFNDAEWDQIRKGVVTVKGKGSYIDPLHKEIPEEVQTKLVAALTSEQNYGVVEPTAESRVFLHLGHKPGSLWNESARAITQFSGHPVTFMLLHFRRIANMEGVLSKMGYAGSLLVGGTTLGLMATWARDVAKGKEPRYMKEVLDGTIDPVEARGLLKEAFIRGGAGAWFADYLLADPYAYGGPGSRLLGPTLGNINKVIGTMNKFVDKGDERGYMDSARRVLAPEIAKFGMDSMLAPVTKAWHTRLLADRLALDFAHKAIDPEFNHKSLRARRRAHEQRQPFFLEPGHYTK